VLVDIFWIDVAEGNHPRHTFDGAWGVSANIRFESYFFKRLARHAAFCGRIIFYIFLIISFNIIFTHISIRAIYICKQRFNCILCQNRIAFGSLCNHFLLLFKLGHFMYVNNALSVFYANCQNWFAFGSLWKQA
jgi:hypothetical protein